MILDVCGRWKVRTRSRQVWKCGIHPQTEPFLLSRERAHPPAKKKAQKKHVEDFDDERMDLGVFL